jgi:hypothetical protein
MLLDDGAAGVVLKVEQILRVLGHLARPALNCGLVRSQAASRH